LNKNKKCSIAALVNALAWVTQNVGLTGRRSVVNLSLGGSQTSDTIKRAIEELHRLNIPISVAAGNVKSDACLSSPQDSELVFTVGASDQQDYVAEFSSFGKCVDIFAPGANITSASSSDVNHNVLLSGTSQAAPFVAGQMAILMSLYPDISVDELYDILRKTATAGVIKGLRTDDPDLLLFNGIKTVSLGGGNSQWRLIIQTLLSGFL
jgi:subtilisin family serine protease